MMIPQTLQITPIGNQVGIQIHHQMFCEK